MTANTSPDILHRWPSIGCAALLLIVSILASLPSLAAPGAHGPGGEHLDAPGVAATGAGLPRIEAQTESFELVGTLRDHELSLLIDRYDSNEPVLDATVEVESAGVRATATFHADAGDYAFTDERLLAALERPGEHALLFTIVTTGDSDLVDAALRVESTPVAAGPTTHAAAWLSGALAAALVVWLTVRRFAARKERRP